MTVLRMKSGRHRKAARGGYVGGFVPHGYKVQDGEHLEGRPTKRGKTWYPSTVKALLEGEERRRGVYV